MSSDTIQTASGKDRVIWAWFPVTLLTAIFCCVLWGSASPAIKIAYELFKIGPEDTASRIMLAGARFMIAGVMTILFGSLLARKFLLPKKESWKNVLVLSLVQTVGQYYFFFMALANTSGVRGSIINASGNFIAILFAVYIFRFEKMTLKKLAGCLVGFAGILLILGGGQALLEGGRVTLAGEGAMLAADFFYAASGCLIKIFSRDENPVALSGYRDPVRDRIADGRTARILYRELRAEPALYGLHLCRRLYPVGRTAQVQPCEPGVDPGFCQSRDGRSAVGTVPGRGQGSVFPDRASRSAARQRGYRDRQYIGEKAISMRLMAGASV